MTVSPAAVWKAIASTIGPDEILLAVALALVTAGLWPIALRWFGAGRAALAVPGLVLLWVVLPSRVPFIATPIDEKPSRARDGERRGA